MSPANYGAIDPWVLWRVAAGDLEIFRTLAWIYLEQAPALAQRLQQGLAEDARADIRMASHTLNGMAAMLGAGELCGVLQQIELAAGEGLRAPPVAEQVAALCLRVQRELEACAIHFDGAAADRGA
jgi:HPt (histidine-containing phosphotransfer) domain-containing protein